MPKVRKQLTLDQKIDILDQLDGGARQIDLATKYGISAANVSIIKKKFHRNSSETGISVGTGH